MHMFGFSLPSVEGDLPVTEGYNNNGEPLGGADHVSVTGQGLCLY